MDRTFQVLLLITICLVGLPACKVTTNQKSECNDDYTYACLLTKSNSYLSNDLSQQLSLLDRYSDSDASSKIERYESAKPSTGFEDAFLAFRLSQFYFLDKDTYQEALNKAEYAVAKKKLNAGHQKFALKLVYDISVALQLREKALAAKQEYNRFMGIPFTSQDEQLVSIDVQRGHSERKDIRVPPHYPSEAARDRIEGHVVMLFDLNEDGTTGNIRVIDSFPEGVFDKAGIKALERWVYYPENRPADKKNQMTDLKVRLDWKLEN